ncbi:MAG: NnrS family protein [Candidatus Tectomicrobia bacterium]|uniref:NnrS family protein n=1 Tax=Tectimicrobiota bacterium TaxID=2528274 RepID=A0A932CMY8_UNCTE|nr:NnrS family protein [Candidatus Tectomicrobia bacterium]
MRTRERIHPEMTVREINLRYPACREVFARHGMGGCGGAYGPPEPIDLFARSHRIQLDQLIQELEAAVQANGTRDEGEGRAEDEGTLYGLCQRFVKTAILITLSFGTLWGVILLTQIAWGRSFQAPGYAEVQAHGHAQFFGWVGLFIMGVAYYVLPKFKDVPFSRLQYRLANLSLGLMATGVAVRAVSQPLADSALFAGLEVVSAAVEWVSVVLFVGISLQIFSRSRSPREFYDPYLLGSLVWFLGMGLMNLILISQAALHLETAIRGPWNSAFLHLTVYGFMANMIFGVSFRVLPNFLVLRQQSERAARLAFWLFNVGVFARAFVPGWAVLSSLLEGIGIVLVVRSLGIFTRPVVQLVIPGVDQAFGWFIKAGYGWLLIAGLMVLGGDLYALVSGELLPHAYVGSYRHAITVGFITSLILGVAYRILPIFNGTELYRPGLMRLSFYLLLLGNTLRVVFQAGTLVWGHWPYLLVGVSGYLELSALALFGWNIFQTLREASGEDFLKDRAVSGGTRVADLLDACPEVRSLLVRLGLEGLRAEGHRVPRFITLDFAARRHGLDPEGIVGAINGYLSTAPQNVR